MTDISFSPSKHDFVYIPGLVCRHRKQRRFDFLIDTGASITMIDPGLMESIGYASDCPEYTGPASVSGPSGRGEGFRVKVHKLLLFQAKWSLDNVEVICLRPEKGVEALLGINFLKHFHYCINHRDHVFSLNSF